MSTTLEFEMDEDRDHGCHQWMGHGDAGGRDKGLVRPHRVPNASREDGFRAMAADAERKADARDWVEGLLGSGAT